MGLEQRSLAERVVPTSRQHIAGEASALHFVELSLRWLLFLVEQRFSAATREA